MKNYLAVFIGSKQGKKADSWNALNEEIKNARGQEGMRAWKDWIKTNEKAIVFMGSPLGPTMLVDDHGISQTKNLLCAYTVVQAESHEAAAKIFEKHPHFSIFPGDGIEVIECLPIPGAESK